MKGVPEGEEGVLGGLWHDAIAEQPESIDAMVTVDQPCGQPISASTNGADKTRRLEAGVALEVLTPAVGVVGAGRGGCQWTT
jgi:hypothetical protein